MNKKGEQANIQGILLGILGVGLFFGMITILITSNSSYDTGDVDLDDISKYQLMENISDRVNEAKSDIDAVRINKNWFDFLSGVFNVILTPFQFIYRSISLVLGLGSSIANDLHLPKIIGDYLITALTIIIFVGIVMIKFYMGKRK